MKKYNKKIIIALFAVIILVGIILIGKISYAYFTADVINKAIDVTLKVSGGKIEINYEEGTNIEVSGMVPSNYPVVIKEFIVTGINTTNKEYEMLYYLELVVEENDFLNNIIGYKLIGINNEGGILSTELIMLENIANEYASGVGMFEGLSSGEIKHNYRLEIYFPESNEAQMEKANKKIKVHIEINDDITLITETKITERVTAINSSGTLEMGTKVK